MQLEFLTAGQRVEQAHAHPGFRNVADDADEFALRRYQFDGANQQRETRRDALVRACRFRRIILPCEIRSLVHARVALRAAPHPGRRDATGRVYPMLEANQ